MEKQIIFISHITEEKELALSLKQLIEDKFLGMVEIFVSSDENSIRLGQEWLVNITENLRSCCIELILCSPASVNRSWINFEAGAGWVRKNCKVIPVCHSNMKPEELPLPLNLLQGMMLNDQIKIQELLKIIADQIGCKVPSLDCSEFISKVEDFEEKYIYWDALNHDFKELFEILSKDGFIEGENHETFNLKNTVDGFNFFLINLFKNNTKFNVNIPITITNNNAFERLCKKEIFVIQNTGSVLTPNGVFKKFTLQKSCNFDETVTNPKFAYCILEVINAK